MICTLQHQIRGILVLARALGAGYLSILENVDSLPAEHGMVIGGSQRIGNAFLIANAISAVLRLPVNSIAGDAEYSFLVVHCSKQGVQEQAVEDRQNWNFHLQQAVGYFRPCRMWRILSVSI